MAHGKYSPSSAASPQTFSELLEIVGPMGWFQWLSWGCIGFTLIFGTMINMSNVFFAYEQDIECSVPDSLSNSTKWTDAQKKAVSYPKEENGKGYSTCKRFNRSFEDYLSMALTGNETIQLIETNEDNTTVACTSWVYDESVMASTIVKEWDFVCGRAINIATSQSVYMAGILVGSLLASTVADFIGRKTAFSASGCILCFFSICQSFAPTYPIFLALRFFVAFGMAGTWMCGFVYAQEITSVKWRSWIGSCYWLPGTLGLWGLAGFAYWLRRWRPLQLAMSIPQVFYLACFWLIPESPRWLLARGKIDRAQRVIERAAKLNGTKLPPDINYDAITRSLQKETEATTEDFRSAMKLLFSSGVYVVRTLIVWFDWFVISMVFYGLVWNIGSVSGDIFINLIISGAIEIPGCIFTCLLLKWGRKRGLIMTFAVTGIACLSKIARIKSLDVFYYFVARFFCGACFGIIYCYTVELYPTVIRNTIQGSGSTAARVGSILSPYIIIIPSLWPKNSAKAHEMAIVPDMIFGVLSLAAAIVSFMLPETKGWPMPDLIQDGLMNKSKIEKMSFKNYRNAPGIGEKEKEAVQQTKL